jgi:hypothetical protein
MGLAEEMVKRDTGPERAATVWAEEGAAVLEELFLEAAKPRSKVVNRLPAVRTSFQQWVLDTCKVFQLRVPDVDFSSVKRAKSQATAPNPTTGPKDQI